MRFVIDENLGEPLARGLQEFGEEVVHTREKFGEGTADTSMLKDLGSQQLFLVTRDRRIRSRPNELRALKENNVGAFFLGGKNGKRCHLIRQLVRNWHRIKEHAATKRRPFAFEIASRGATFRRIPLD